MGSGYENSPDYGGPEWHWRHVISAAIGVILVAGAYIALRTFIL